MTKKKAFRRTRSKPLALTAFLQHYSRMLISYTDQLQAAAEKSGVKLEDICEKAGIHQTTIFRWKTKRSSPRFNEANRLMKAIKEAS